MKAYQLIKKLEQLNPMTDILIDMTDGVDYFKFAEIIDVITFDPDEDGDAHTVITPNDYNTREHTNN